MGLSPGELDAELLSAAWDNDLAGVCEWLRRGADTEAEDKGMKYDIRTALMIAATDGHLELARLLRNNGAAVNLAIGAASEDRNRKQALHYAAGSGGQAMTEWLLSEGADANGNDGAGRTALWHAAYWGRTGIAELLLSAGARVDDPDIYGGGTALWGAVFGSTSQRRAALEQDRG